MAGDCPFIADVHMERRPANALCVEAMAPTPRCTLRPPGDWPEGMALRWLGSGGSPLVFGPCTPLACPRGLVGAAGE